VSQLWADHPNDIDEYLIATGERINRTESGNIKTPYPQQIPKHDPDTSSVIYSHIEDVLSFTIVETAILELVCRAVFL
jgi:hypothetical protein